MYIYKNHGNMDIFFFFNSNVYFFCDEVYLSIDEFIHVEAQVMVLKMHCFLKSGPIITQKNK